MLSFGCRITNWPADDESPGSDWYRWLSVPSGNCNCRDSGGHPVNTFARQDHMAAVFPMFSGLSVPAHIAPAYRSAYKYWKPININSEDWRKIHKRLWMIWWSHRPVDITTGNWSRSDTVIQSRVSISHVGGDGIDRWSGGWRRFVNGRAFVNTPPVVSPLEMRSTSSSASCARLCRWHIKHLRIRIIKREPCLNFSRSKKYQ